MDGVVVRMEEDSGGAAAASGGVSHQSFTGPRPKRSSVRGIGLGLNPEACIASLSRERLAGHWGHHKVLGKPNLQVCMHSRMQGAVEWEDQETQGVEQEGIHHVGSKEWAREFLDPLSATFAHKDPKSWLRHLLTQPPFMAPLDMHESRRASSVLYFSECGRRVGFHRCMHACSSPSSMWLSIHPSPSLHASRNATYEQPDLHQAYNDIKYLRLSNSIQHEQLGQACG